MGGNKPFLTYEQQINKLTTEKGLIIENVSHAMKLLEKHGYYSFVSGYKTPFKGSDNKYKPGVSLTDIYALYQFDDKLRNILLKNILAVELHIKSLISYAFCEKHLEDQRHYLNASCYDSSNANKEEIAKLIIKFKDALSAKEKPAYIRHQLLKYNNVPLWVMIKTLSLGNISKMYSMLAPDVKSAVSHKFTGIREKELATMLDLLSRFRNVCAHNERLYNYFYAKSRLCETQIHIYFGNKSNCYRSFFAVIIVLKYLLNPEEYSVLLDNIKSEMTYLVSNTSYISMSYISRQMGMPKNWMRLKALELEEP